MMYYKKALVGIALCCAFLLVVSPLPAFGQAGGGGAPLIPFGGRILALTACANGAVYVKLGPPKPGFYIWHPGTLTFLNGPPRRVGQALLGKAGPVYLCVVPGGALPGLSMIMVGSSL